MRSMQTLQSGEGLRERSPDLGVAECGTCGCLSPGQGLNPATRASLSQRWATQAEAEVTFGVLDWSRWQVMGQMSLQWTFHFPVSLGFCFVLCLLNSQTFNIVYCWNQLAGHLHKAFFHIYVQDGLIFVCFWALFVKFWILIGKHCEVMYDVSHLFLKCGDLNRVCDFGIGDS